MNFQLTPELLAGIVGVIISLLFSYVPKFNTWYAALESSIKSLIMLVMLLVVTGAIFGGACLSWFTTDITCNQAGVWKAISIFISALIANQGIYQLSPTTRAVSDAKGEC